jgi:hypothetical protein
MGNSTGVLDRFYSKLSPFMNPGLHSGRDLRNEQLELQKTIAVPELAQPTASVPMEALETPRTAQQAPALSAAAKAFDLFDAGKLSESALLIALGVARAGYDPSEELRLRALTAFESERLSEDALVKVLG